jgi:hypothetical protein
MQKHRWIYSLTGVNVLLTVLTLTRSSPAASDATLVIHTQERGRARARRAASTRGGASTTT